MSRAGVVYEAVGIEPVLHTRTRTKPEVKGLANELAAVKGELERIDEALSRLHARKSKLLAVQVALSDVAGQLTIPELPAVVPAVRANERYGARGNLRNLLREMLQKAYPLAVDTLSMTDAVVARFGLTFPNAKARQRFRKYSVSNTLLKLFDRGEVERVHDFRALPNSVGAWRWKVEAPTLDQLRRDGADLTGLTGAVCAEGDFCPEGEPWR